MVQKKDFICGSDRKTGLTLGVGLCVRATSKGGCTSAIEQVWPLSSNRLEEDGHLSKKMCYTESNTYPVCLLRLCQRCAQNDPVGEI